MQIKTAGAFKTCELRQWLVIDTNTNRTKIIELANPAHFDDQQLEPHLKKMSLWTEIICLFSPGSLIFKSLPLSQIISKIGVSKDKMEIVSIICQL